MKVEGVSAEQPWNPGYLVQPLTALGLGLFFEWGVALHDLRLEERIIEDAA